MYELEGKIEPSVEIKAEIVGTGPRGRDGKDGYTPVKGVDYFDGVDGKDGYNPVKGKDYWTPAEVEEIVEAPKRAEEARVAEEEKRTKAETARNTAEEERQKSEILRAEAEAARVEFWGSAEGKISELKTDLVAKADKTTLEKTTRSLDALWKLNQGISYQFEKDATTAYQKDIPTGAKLAALRNVGGRTIFWNQKRNYNDEKNKNESNGLTIVRDGAKLIINGTSTGVVNFPHTTVSGRKKDHKYLLKGCAKGGGADKYYTCLTGVTTIGNTVKRFDYGEGSICQAVGDSSSNGFSTVINEGQTFENAEFTPMIFDLTQMFGAGNEPATVEEFEAMFPYESYLCNEGELMNVSVDEIVNTDADGAVKGTAAIPQAVLDVDGYGRGINDAVYNYVDFESKTFHRNVGLREFADGDAENADVLTDGTNTVYPLAEEEIVDISDILTDIEPFEVESGGTMTFKNTNGDGYRISVPNSVEYVVSLKEVGTA